MGYCSKFPSLSVVITVPQIIKIPSINPHRPTIAVVTPHVKNPSRTLNIN